MRPLSFLLIAAAIGAALAWGVQDWRYQGQLAQLDAAQARHEAQQAQTALLDLSENVNRLAARASEADAQLKETMNAIPSDWSEETSEETSDDDPPVAACVLSASRLRFVAAGVDAVNRAIDR